MKNQYSFIAVWVLAFMAILAIGFISWSIVWINA
jgi:hypothetical protein